MNKTNTPQIRFKGFTEAWEQRKLSELGKVLTGNTPPTSERENWAKDENDYVWITPTDINALKMSGSERHLTAVGWGKARFVPSNSVLITSIASIGKNAINTVPAAFNQQINAIVPIGNSAYFILTAMENEKARFAGLAGKTATAIINKTEFEKFSFLVPKLQEQERISGFFENFDNLITLHQRKCEMLQKTKKALLEKMFPQNGSAFPEVRFKGFTETWEQRKLSDAVDVRSGQDYKHLSKGDIPVYGTGGYMLSVDKALSYSEDAIGIGRKGTIDKPYLLHAPFWTVDTLFYTVPRRGYSLEFIHSVFQRIDWKRKDESTGVPSLSKTTINDIEILVPEFIEQKHIGTFFTEIDNLITLHQRELEKLQKLKSACLQKMFV